MKNKIHLALILALSLTLVNCATQGIQDADAAAAAQNSIGFEAGKSDLPSEQVVVMPVADLLRNLDLKMKEMEADLKLADKELKARGTTRNKLKKEAMALGRRLAADKKKLQDRHLRTEQITNETKALIAQKEQMSVEKSDLAKKNEEAERQSRPFEQQYAEAKSKFEAAHRARDSELKKLEASREKSDALESEVRKTRQKIEGLEAQVKDSESESKVADALLKDRQERLVEITTKASARESELNAKYKIDVADVDQAPQRGPASTQAPIGLQLIRKSPAKNSKTKPKHRVRDDG